MNCMILFLMPVSTLDLGVGKKVVVHTDEDRRKGRFEVQYIASVPNWLTSLLFVML